jgi:hypothetical protein
MREDGAATIEALLWIPLMLIFFSLLADATMIFSGQARALRVLQDGNRRIAVGFLDTCAQVESYVEDRLEPLSPGADASCSIDSATNVVTTQVTMPASDLDIAGLLSSFDSLQVTVSTQHLLEDLS